MASNRRPFNLTKHLNWIADKSLVFGPDSPFTATITPADARLAVIVGENASGKSLLLRALNSRAAQANLQPVTVSIRERTGTGTHEMARMRQMIMFGDEVEQSSGATSVTAVNAAFKNLPNLGKTKPTLLGLDEPELALSDGYAEALGHHIGQLTKDIPSTCAGVVVVTHNRHLVAGLRESYGTDPTFVTTGNSTPTLDEWLTTPEQRSVAELLELPTIGAQRWRATNDLLKD